MSAGFRQAGDGDRCPQDPEHGRMWFSTDRQSQWCPHSGHKGINRYAFDGVTPKPREPLRFRGDWEDVPVGGKQ